MEVIKKNITFILGISIPLLMILFVAGSIYLPSFFVEPLKYNFLYTVDDYNLYIDGQQYLVKDGKIIKNEIIKPEDGSPIYENAESRLFIYDVVKNESKQISFEEAQKLNLDQNIESPDGFEVVYGSSGSGGFLFFYSGNNYNLYIKGHNTSKKLNTQLGERYYYSFSFLGWIKN
jgi:hypothetical protein